MFSDKTLGGNNLNEKKDVHVQVREEELEAVKTVRQAEDWERHVKIEDVMDLESFVHLRTHIWKSLREEHGDRH